MRPPLIDHTESPKAQDNNFNRDLGEIKKTEVFRTRGPVKGKSLMDGRIENGKLERKRLERHESRHKQALPVLFFWLKKGKYICEILGPLWASKLEVNSSCIVVGV